MVSVTDDPAVAARREWMGVLAQARREELEQAWEAAGSPEASQWIRAAETGLVMVRGRAGGDGTRFNLGEMTATRCACRIEGSEAIGFAITAGRDKRKAEIAALLDAVLQDAPERAEILSPLRQAQTERREAESAKAAATRVDFFTMVRGE